MDNKATLDFIKPPRTIKNVYIRSLILITASCTIFPLSCAVIMLVAVLQGLIAMIAELCSNVKDGWVEVCTLASKHYKSTKVMMNKKFVAKEQ